MFLIFTGVSSHTGWMIFSPVPGTHGGYVLIFTICAGPGLFLRRKSYKGRSLWSTQLTAQSPVAAMFGLLLIFASFAVSVVHGMLPNRNGWSAF